MGDRLAEIKVRWGEIGLATQPHEPEWWVDRAGEDIIWLVTELERAWNMLRDCRKHRDRAERSERVLMQIREEIGDVLATYEPGE